MSEENKPIHKIRAGGVVATVWENERENKDGNKYTSKSVTIERSFKDQEDNWQTTNSFNIVDLAKLQAVLMRVNELILISKEEHSKMEE